MRKLTVTALLFLGFALSVSAQRDTAALKTYISALIPDNTSGAITPEDLRESHFEVNRSNANLFERNTFSETIESLDSIKSDAGFFQWNGSSWVETGNLADTALWGRTGGYMLPLEYGDTISVRSIRVEKEIFTSGKANIGYLSTPFDTIFIDEIYSSGQVRTNGITLTTGNQGAGKVLVSDAAGFADWQTVTVGTGWAAYTDTTYDSGNKWALTQGDTAKFPFFWDTNIDSQIPLGIDSLFNRSDTTLIGFNGDSYTVRVNFTAEVSSANGYCSMIYDIGNGTPIIITERVVNFPRGANTPHDFSLTTSIYALGTFESNGCSVKFHAEDGNLEVWDLSIIVTRTHKAR